LQKLRWLFYPQPPKPSFISGNFKNNLKPLMVIVDTVFQSPIVAFFSSKKPQTQYLPQCPPFHKFIIRSTISSTLEQNHTFLFFVIFFFLDASNIDFSIISPNPPNYGFIFCSRFFNFPKRFPDPKV
jgi:hypothetical protein